MNSKYILISFSFIMSMLFTACSDYLNVKPTDQLDEDVAFSSEANADLFLNTIYGDMPDETSANFTTYDGMEHWSDNVCNKFDWAISWVQQTSRSYSPETFYDGLYNHGYPAVPFMYNTVYRWIRSCNLFIAKIEEFKSNFSEEWYNKRLGEAMFLRAYLYHNLWKGYGGVPIITEPLNRLTMGDDIFRPRNTRQETFDFLVKDLETAASLLPNEIGTGRATRGAALALKGFVELYHHEYAMAAKTNKIIIDEGIYKLFPGYNELFYEQNSNNQESIYAIQHGPKRRSQENQYFGPNCGVNRNDSWGCMQPTVSLANDYRMKNGLPITDPNSGFDPQNPYKDREPRFYWSIVHHGSVWRGDTINTMEGALDAPNPATEKRTGMWRRKGMNENISTAEFNTDGMNFILLRYAEVLLNYAEAKIELNEIDQSVIDAIDQIRLRGQIPTLKDTYEKSSFSQEELRRICRQERRIELAFEYKRYWDLIRWGNLPDGDPHKTDYYTAEVELNKPFQGYKIAEDGTFTVFDVHQSVFYKDKNYLFPLYREWILQNPKIHAQNGGEDNLNAGQNPGY